MNALLKAAFAGEKTGAYFALARPFGSGSGSKT
jgi:hypothetical protein